MHSLCNIVLLLLSAAVVRPSSLTDHSHKYCVVGAGPAGLQLGYLFEQHNLDYAIIERNTAPGSFFQQYPIHRKLISINKRYTGHTDKDYNLRHDW
jgi:NADPH-dependent 2,4-dienoyl-CoA reductase/sulfur reductase-like enzyme